MGSPLELSVSGSSAAICEAALGSAIVAVSELEAEVSTWIPESAFSRLNAAPAACSIPLSPEAARGLARALEWRTRSEGAFSPLCGGLLHMWDFRGAGRVPAAEEVRLGVQRHARAALEVSESEVRRETDDAVIEEGGYAKGQALDLALAEARAAGVERFDGNFGGQLIHWSSSETSWECEISDPLDRSRGVATLSTLGGSVSTSGQSERRIVVDGTPYGHILDPRSGFPVPGWGTATVVAPSAIDADCLSTALLVMGPTAGAAWLTAHPQYEAVLVEVSSLGYVFHVTARLSSALNVHTTRPHRIVVLPQDSEHKSH